MCMCNPLLQQAVPSPNLLLYWWQNRPTMNPHSCSSSKQNSQPCNSPQNTVSIQLTFWVRRNACEYGSSSEPIQLRSAHSLAIKLTNSICIQTSVLTHYIVTPSHCITLRPHTSSLDISACLHLRVPQNAAQISIRLSRRNFHRGRCGLTACLLYVLFGTAQCQFKNLKLFNNFPVFTVHRK